MTLRQKQSKFTLLLTKLIRYAAKQGLEPVLDEVYRPPELADLYAALGRGSAKSLHTLKLAADVNCYRDGKFLSKTSDYEALGSYWKSLDTDCRWGGDFDDGRHFSLTHGGRA
jgi:hypothetical protein